VYNNNIRCVRWSGLVSGTGRGGGWGEENRETMSLKRQTLNYIFIRISRKQHSSGLKKAHSVGVKKKKNQAQSLRVGKKTLSITISFKGEMTRRFPLNDERYPLQCALKPYIDPRSASSY